jgi:tetratricopeptide (TPR) repeat protein
MSVMEIAIDMPGNFEQLIAEAEKLCGRRNAGALEFIARARIEAELTGDTRQMHLVEYVQAYADCFINNNYELSINRLIDTLSELSAEELDLYGFKLYGTLGNSYQLKGDPFSSQESYLKGLRCLESKGSLTETEEIFLAGFYYNLSILLGSSVLKIESEEYLEKAISIYLKHDKRFQLSKCYAAYAQIFERKEQFEPALDFLFKALQIDEALNEPYSLALTRANVGIVLIKTGESEKAFNYLHDALEFYEAHDMTRDIGLVKFELGQAMDHAGNLELGLEHIDEAERLMISIDNKKELSDIYKVKANVLKRLGSHAVANEYLEKYVESLKFFYDSEKTNALTRAKKEFESELKEKEAAILRDKNREIQDYVHKLEISNNELKQFAHVASHDLREPLRMIMSYLGLLQRGMNGSMTEQQLEFFGFVIDGAKRMDQLIQDLLRLAKVDANPVIENIKLNNVIEEIKLNLDALIKDKHAKIVVTTLPIIAADRAQMIQLFQNLIANGIKYNKNEIPEIRITALDRKTSIEILVADNGIGIPKHLREEAFQIFRRLHKNSVATGSGIGLAICKKIVESMNGKISIDDRPGGGTVFSMILPKAEG